MALSIGVSNGSLIRVGEHRVLVKAVVNSTLLVVTVDGGQDITVSDKERVEILPQVFVFAGVGNGGVGNRLAFEAPRSIPIHRKGGSDERQSRSTARDGGRRNLAR